MKVIKYLLVGFVFGIVLTKSEAVSWYRIYEMFQFDSFHMYGIIMVAIFTGIIGIQIMKRRSIKDIKGVAIEIKDKDQGSARYLIGGVFFWIGLGSCRCLSRSDIHFTRCWFLECFDCSFWSAGWDVFIWSFKR
jgi:hypothetical protein